MFGFGRAAMPRGPPLQAGNQIVIQIAYVQIAGHSRLREIIAYNDLTEQQAGQESIQPGAFWTPIWGPVPTPIDTKGH